MGICVTMCNLSGCTVPNPVSKFLRTVVTALFRGESEHSLDEKNRLTIPQRLRSELGEVFYVTRGLDNCLFAFPATEWNAFEEKLCSLPMSTGRASMRFFFSGTMECSCDKQGRILLSQALRDYADITKDVVIVGVSKRVEIWSKEKWVAYNESISADPDEIASQLELLNM